MRNISYLVDTKIISRAGQPQECAAYNINFSGRGNPLWLPWLPKT